MSETDTPLLRPLSGIGLAAYRVLWIALFALSLLLNTVMAYRSASYDAEQARIRYRAGVHINISPAGGYTVLPFSDEARSLGLGRERLLAVDGHLAIGAMPEVTRLLDGPEDSPVELTLARVNGSVHRLVLHRRTANIDQAYAGSGLNQRNLNWFYYLARAIDGWSLLVAGALLFVRRPSDPVAAILSLGMVLLATNLRLILPDQALVQANLTTSLGSALLLFGTLLFPDARPLRRWAWPGGVAIAIYLAVSVLRRVSVAFDPVELPVFVAAYAVVIAAAAARYRELPRGTKRQQMKFALLGFALAAVFLLIEVPLSPRHLPVLSEGVTSWLLVLNALASSFSSAALAGGLLVSLLRYRLYDAETAISRSVMFGALTVTLLAIFAGSEKIIEILGEEYFGEEMGVLAGGLGAAVAAAMIGPLHHRVSHWAEHRFQGALVHLRQGLPLLLGDLRETASPKHLANTLLERVEHGVRAQHGAVLVEGHVLELRDVSHEQTQEWLVAWEPGDARHIDCHRADPLFPMRVRLHADGVGEVGWLLLGPRPDGSFYGKDERETLALVADPAARALAITIERQKREAAQSHEIRSLRSLVEQLAARLGPEPTAAGT